MKAILLTVAASLIVCEASAQGLWVDNDPNAQVNITRRFFQANDDCIRATLKVEVENGFANMKIFNLSPQSTLKFLGDGKTFRIGGPNCRVKITVEKDD